MKRLLATIGVSGLVLILAVAFGVALPDQAYAKYTTKTTTTIKLSVEKAHYTVRFHANANGDPVVGTMEDQVFTYGEAQALTLNAFERGGYLFDHWSTKASGLGIDYEDGATINLDKENGEIVDLYAQWVEDDEMHTEFETDGVCVFHGYDIQQGTGDGYITGNNCIVNGIDWADGTHRYIDTGVSLYNEENYKKDFEIGFTIIEYNPNQQFHDQDIDEDTATQSTFMNAKFEDKSRNWPGLVVRKSSDKIEIAQTINKNKKTASRNASTTTKVVVARVDGVVYYSFNDGPFTVLQDMNGTSDYFDTTVWFGAAERSDGAPKRYLDATLSNLYIKVGEMGANKHTVSFDAGGVVENPNDVVIISSGKLGSRMPTMPNSVQTDDGLLYFGGWYTEEDGAGKRITEETVIDKNMTLYAYWRDSDNVCRVGGNTYSLLQDCIDEAEPSTTITMLDDIRAQLVSVASDKVITLDLNGHTISDRGVVGKEVISNDGTMTIINGTITSSQNAGVINNNSTGKLYIRNNVRILAVGGKQAIFNDGGELEISGNAYLSSSSSIRAAVQNNNASGKITVTGGTIISTKQQGIDNVAGTLIIGIPDGAVNSNAPIIQGATYGVTTSTDIAMYDGKLMGRTGAIDNPNRITASENGAVVVGWDPEVTEVVESLLYKILYYQIP